jgi:hypothetical protein
MESSRVEVVPLAAGILDFRLEGEGGIQYHLQTSSWGGIYKGKIDSQWRLVHWLLFPVLLWTMIYLKDGVE